jgi:predicted transglutaminase-like cysteine proteinase
MKKLLVLSVIFIICFALFTGCISDSDESIFSNKSDKKKEINDRDKDGVEDSLDAFPDDPSASKDSDGDGYPDSWNKGKNSLDSNSNLFIDEFPDDPSEWKDSDKDGIGDNKDINPNVDLSITVKITDFELNKRVDILKWSQIYFDFQRDNQEKVTYDNGGDFWVCWLNHKKNIDFEYTFDIPDDTDQEIFVLSFEFFDHDSFLSDDEIDVTSESGDAFKIQYDLTKNSLNVNPKGVSRGSDASFWYEVLIPGEVNFGREYSFEWSFENQDYGIILNIPDETYNEYKNFQTDERRPSLKKDMAGFVTYDEDVIVDLSKKLDQLIEGFDEVKKINFILRFVQEIISYKSDSSTKNEEEYWRYPVETLVDGKGDCEDSAVLFASITKVLGFDTALLLYILDEDESKQIGHLAAGISISEDVDGKFVVSNNKKYYYCETAYDSKKGESLFKIGDVPSEVKDKYNSPYMFIDI